VDLAVIMVKHEGIGAMAFEQTLLGEDISSIGQKLHEFAGLMYPICRSITGQGVRDTLEMIREKIPLAIHQVPTGTQVFDWVVPMEWNIRDAYIKNSEGKKIVDFKNNNLHVVSYSTPVDMSMTLGELKMHLHTIESQPDCIPYRTSYYSEAWGFCLSHNQLMALPEDNYQVFIDSSLEEGVLNYGEYYIAGDSAEEILFYTHICHPSLCNDNLSGISTVTYLAKILTEYKLQFSYRFIFAPGTIGSISWLSLNEHILSNIKHGLVVALVGDSGKLNYKRNRNSSSEIDKVVCKALEDSNTEFEILDFSPYGYDERQFCSPGINLDVGRLTRTPNNCYTEYHTSADNLAFIKADKMAESLQTILQIVNILENNKTYINTSPKCEPQLGKRGLYDKTGGVKDVEQNALAMLWILNQSDGKNSLLDISIRSGICFGTIRDASKALVTCGLLKLVNNA
jgi:aminopeptidase-like protein